MKTKRLEKFKRGDLIKMMAKEGFASGVEVGVADGRFSLYMCENIPNLELFCIDPWEPYSDNSRYLGYSRRDDNRPNEELARERMSPYNAYMMKAMSMDAVDDFDYGSFDFVYIDGNHDFDYVMQDIIEWSRRVKPGGIVAGHDYYEFKGSGVIEAVNAYANAHDIETVYITDEKEPSWFFRK